MPWYVIQTYTGKEEKLAEMIRRMVPGECYGECFTAYYEQLRHRGQENQIHILRLFPGYVFLSTEDMERVFHCLKQVPAMARAVSADASLFSPLPLYEGEAEILLGMLDEEHVARLSYAATDGKNHISYIAGPLERYRERVKIWQFRKRYAGVRVEVCGQEKEVRMGLILNEDIRRETLYGKVEAPVEIPGKYTIPERKASSGKSEPQFQPGDQVAVIEGAFGGNPAKIIQAGKGTVRIAVWLFGREIPVEIPEESVRKTGD